MTAIRSMTVIALVLATSCIRGEHRDARAKYDEGVADLVKGDFEAAEKALIDARSNAGVDPELRFRAAYDLGMAYAAHADQAKSGKDADLAKGLSLEEQAVSWFGDAGRLRPDDADTKANLAIARLRVAAINDELNKGEGKLEARLDALIGEQRKLLDDGRAAWVAIKSAGGADPLAQQTQLTHLADVERGIVAEAGVIGDLAADEIDAIGKKPEDKRSEQEKIRVVQLKNLDLYLLEARARIAEARRKLQELDAEAGTQRAEAAMIQLKRAREQLLDPITVLREVAQDELALMEDTARSAAAHTGKLELEKSTPAPAHAGSGAAAAPDVVLAWMLPKPMADRQSGLKDRVEEIRARLAAGVEHADATAAGSGSDAGSAEPPAPVDPKQQKMLERVRAALPSVVEAIAAMDRATQALSEARNADAELAERQALLALGRAIEQFSDLKQTIELAHAEQQHVLAMLSPEAAKEMSGADRAKETQDAVARNLIRIARLQELIADEVTELASKQQQVDAKAAQLTSAGSGAAAGSGSAGGPDPKQQIEDAKHQLEQAKQQLTKAEELRGEASIALNALTAALAASKDPDPSAHDAAAKIDELRKLFFSVIEHLQELVRVQGETRDQTSVATGQDDATRAPMIPGLIARQGEHGAMAKAITDALAAQADAAAKAPASAGPAQSGQPSPAQQAKTFAAAADEVRQAQGDMGEASTTLTKVRDATNTSQDLKPAVDSQAKAIDHLQAALKLLAPPPPPKDDQKQDPKDKQDQKQDPKDKQDQKQKQDQAKQDPPRQGGAGQRARDEDARRQRERQKPQGTDDNVDRDW